MLCNEQVLVVREDGALEAYEADNGHLVAQARLPEAVRAAWVTSDGLAGCTASLAWAWTGGALQASALPAEAAAAGPGALLSSDHRLFRRQTDGGWKELGRFVAVAKGSLLAWGENVVVPCGDTLHVVGPKPFVVSTKGEFLAPCLLGTDLVVATSIGEIWRFAP
jgi:hypothetical protein